MTYLTRQKSEVRYLVVNWAIMPLQVLKLYNELDGFLRLLKYLRSHKKLVRVMYTKTVYT